MNGIEKITERILADAQAEIDAVLAEAHGQAADIRSRYEVQGQRELAERVRRGQEQAQEREERLTGAAYLETRKVTLATKQGMLDRAFDQALETLRTLPAAEYTDFLARLAASACHDGTEAVILSSQDREKLGAQVVKAANQALKAAKRTAKLTLSDETRETGGGLILSLGNIETNCTFETLLHQARDGIAVEVSQILFPAG